MAFFDYNLQQKLKEYRFGEYLRRSSSDREDKQMRSIEGQKQDLQEDVIDKLGIDVKLVLEESQSAFKMGRPKFELLIQEIENGNIDALLVWHPNRISRNYADGGRFAQLMSDNKLKVVLTPHGIFENTPRDREYLMTEFTRATRDSDDKSEAVKRGNRTKLKAGFVPNGRLSEGYIHVKNTEGEMVQDADPDRFPLLKKAVRLILDQQYTPMEALDMLNNQWGYRIRKTKRMGGGPMSKSTFYKLLNDPKYAGEIQRSEGNFKAAYPTLMNMEEYDKLQIILGNISARRRTKKDWPYDGKEMVCGECGSSIIQDEKWHVVCTHCKEKFNRTKTTVRCPYCQTLIAVMKFPKIYHHVWVYCSKKKKLPDGSRCKQKYLKVKDFEHQVDKILSSIEIPQGFTDWAIKWLKRLNYKEVSDRSTINKNLQNLYNDTQKQIDDLLDVLLKGLISKEEYQKKKELLLLEKEDLKKRLNQTDQRAYNWLELAEKTFNFATNAKHWFEKGNSEEKRGILRTIGSNLVLKDKVLALDQREPFLIIKRMKENNEKSLKKFGPEEISLTNAQNLYPEVVTPSLLRG